LEGKLKDAAFLLFLLFDKLPPFGLHLMRLDVCIAVGRRRGRGKAAQNEAYLRRGIEAAKKACGANSFVCPVYWEQETLLQGLHTA
jgi:hypothetical protein